jgi:hypothetical protein
VKTWNLSACVTMDLKLCKSAIALYLSVIKRTCKRIANKSSHPINKHVIFVKPTTLHVTILKY